MNEDAFHALLGSIVGEHFPKERNAFALGGKRLVQQIVAQNEAGTKADPEGTLATMQYALIAWCTFPVVKEVTALLAAKTDVDEAMVAAKWSHALTGGWLLKDIADKIVAAHSKALIALAAVEASAEADGSRGVPSA